VIIAVTPTFFNLLTQLQAFILPHSKFAGLFEQELPTSVQRPLSLSLELLSLNGRGRRSDLFALLLEILCSEIWVWRD